MARGITLPLGGRAQTYNQEYAKLTVTHEHVKRNYANYLKTLSNKNSCLLRSQIGAFINPPPPPPPECHGPAPFLCGPVGGRFLAKLNFQ